MILNGFDIAVLSIIGISSLLAMFRGFLREMLSLAAWVGAGIITFLSYDSVGEALKPHVSHDMIAIAGGALATFVAALIVLSVINLFIIKAAKKADIGPLDRSLGLMFGLLRGLFIVSLTYMVFSVVMAKQEKPDWAESAITGRLVETGAGFLADLAPGFLKEVESIASAVNEKSSPKQISHTKEPGLIDSILIRQTFSALNAKEKEAVRTITHSIPAMQLPRPVGDPSALSTKEASNLMINMVRLYKTLEKKGQLDAPEEATKEPDAKPAAPKEIAPKVGPEMLSALEDKLMVIYMQARDVPAAETSTAPGKPGDDGYSAKQRQQMQQLIQSVGKP